MSAEFVSGEVDAFSAELARKARRSARIAWVAFIVVGLAVLTVVGVALRPWVHTTLRWFRLSRLASAERAHPAHTEALDPLYGHLVSEWAIALDRAGDDPISQAHERELLAEMASHAAGVPAVAAVVGRLRALEADGVLDDDASAAVPLFDEWNAALQVTHSPFLVYARTHVDAVERAHLWLTTYRAAIAGQARVGAVRVGASVVTRYDHAAGSDPGYAVRLPNGRVLVFLPSVREFVFTTVWPLLDPSSSAPFSRAIRAEVRAALPATAVESLERTAGFHQLLRNAVQAVNGRVSCGSNYQIVAVPWLGYKATTMLSIANVVSAHGRDVCPAVTPNEADTLIDRSLEMQDDPALRPALAALVSWYARIAIVRDARIQASGLHRRACAACDNDEASDEDRDEAEADLASVAVPGAGASALLFACDEVRRHGWSAGRLDVAFGADACQHPPPSDLRPRASAAEAQLFGSTEPVALGHEFDQVVPLEL